MQHRVPLHRAVPEDLRGEFKDKLAYCYAKLKAYEIEESGEGVLVTLEEGGDPAACEEKIRVLARAMFDRHRSLDRVVVHENRVETPHRAPVWDELVARRLVHPEGSGQISLAGDAARVIEALDRVFARLAADVFAAEEHHYPMMLDIAAMDRCHYFGSFPHHVTFAPHVHEDLDALTALADGSASTADRAAASLARPTHFLSPTVCFHSYLFFADRPIAGPRTITARSRCFRYEGKNFATLERLWDFDMREIVFIGPKAWIEEMRTRCVDETMKIVRAMGLHAWIENANDPFFINNFVAQRFFQLASMTKLELRLLLPFSGASLAGGSFNLHLDFFGKSFGIELAGEPAHTGCVGFGYERWLYALFAQFGPDVGAWPSAVRSVLALG